jgi:hypothetical protein
LQDERPPTSVVRSAQCVQLGVFCALDCIKNGQLWEAMP